MAHHDRMARYDGPIIDAHHHLWDAALGRHPWMTDPDTPLKSLGNIDFLRRDYLVADYLADIGPQPVIGSVFVETVWDRARPVDEEMRWVEGLHAPRAIAARRIAWAPLAAPEAERALDLLQQRPGVVGVRETIRWHPDPARSWAARGLMDDPAWRRGARALQARGMILELLMNPHQCEEVARLAEEMPALRIVVNHCASPMDRDTEGLALWRAGLARMGAQPNVAIKLSNYPAYARDRSLPALAEVVTICVDAFTPARAVFASDYPVGRRTMPYQEIVERFRDIVERFTADEQRALFHDNAARLYGFGCRRIVMRRRTFLAGAASLAAPGIAGADTAKVLRFIPQADLAVLDPIWTTAYVTRNHAYLVFDTLYGWDSQIPRHAADGRGSRRRGGRPHLDADAARRARLP